MVVQGGLREIFHFIPFPAVFGWLPAGTVL